MKIRAMKCGAVEFLTKPLSHQELLDVVQVALERDRARRQREAEIATRRERFESLATREHEVVVMVVSGMLNKQIAAKIGTTGKYCESSSQPRYGKMRAKSLADLVKMVERLKISPQAS
jgi:FixJ family two-component response regulator